MPAHGAEGRAQLGPARVLEALAWTQAGLLADHALALHLLHLPGGVGDDPMAAAKLRRLSAHVEDLHRVHEGVPVGLGGAPLRPVGGLHGDADAFGDDGGHATQLAGSPPGRKPNAPATRALRGWCLSDPPGTAPAPRATSRFGQMSEATMEATSTPPMMPSDSPMGTWMPKHQGQQHLRAHEAEDDGEAHLEEVELVHQARHHEEERAQAEDGAHVGRVDDEGVLADAQHGGDGVQGEEQVRGLHHQQHQEERASPCAGRPRR